MRTIGISDGLGDLLDKNRSRIKDEYITYKLFVDAAVRMRLRAMGIDAGQDEIVPHLEKLQRSKQRHLDKQSIKRTIKVHRQRVANAKRDLDVV